MNQSRRLRLLPSTAKKSNPLYEPSGVMIRVTTRVEAVYTSTPETDEFVRNIQRDLDPLPFLGVGAAAAYFESRARGYTTKMVTEFEYNRECPGISTVVELELLRQVDRSG